MTETWGLTHSVQCTPCSPAPAEPHRTPHNLTRPSFGNTSVMLMKSRPMRFGLGEVLWLKEHSPCNQKQFQNKSNPLLALLNVLYERETGPPTLLTFSLFLSPSMAPEACNCFLKHHPQVPPDFASCTSVVLFSYSFLPKSLSGSPKVSPQKAGLTSEG